MSWLKRVTGSRMGHMTAQSLAPTVPPITLLCLHGPPATDRRRNIAIRLSVRLSARLSLREPVFLSVSPFFQSFHYRNAWTYFDETHQGHSVPGPRDTYDSFNVMGSKVKLIETSIDGDIFNQTRTGTLKSQSQH